MTIKAVRVGDVMMEPEKVAEASSEKPTGFPVLLDGHQWHNPEQFTPKQVEIENGWRLLVEGERADNQGTEFAISPKEADMGWTEGGRIVELRKHWTYRTREPLPDGYRVVEGSKLDGSKKERKTRRNLEL